MNAPSPVQRQYERFPYPPVPWIALPRGPAPRLSLAHGYRLTGRTGSLPHAPRILVAGCGTLEALVCARANPHASEIVALDISRASLQQLSRRVRFHRFMRPWHRLPSIQFHEADLAGWEPLGAFDLILASNFLHHLPDPSEGLARLASWLAPQGLLRLVTYPRASRVLMRATAQYFKSQGLGAGTPRLRAQARAAAARLPLGHPLRECYEHHPEIGTTAGVVDAFFHALENPRSPQEWARACANAGIQLLAEDQRPDCRAGALARRLPAAAALDAWTKLEILDSALTLQVNPVWWLGKGATSIPSVPAPLARSTPPAWDARLSPEIIAELSAAWARIDSLLSPVGESANRLLDALAADEDAFSLASLRSRG